MGQHEFIKTYGRKSRKETWYCLHCPKELSELNKEELDEFKNKMIAHCKEVIDRSIEFTHVMTFKEI